MLSLFDSGYYQYRNENLLPIRNDLQKMILLVLE